VFEKPRPKRSVESIVKLMRQYTLKNPFFKMSIERRHNSSTIGLLTLPVMDNSPKSVALKSSSSLYSHR
jgi:hypothetical protein